MSSLPDMTEMQIRRYARHIVLAEVGGVGQAKLIASRVLVVGAGGLGAPLLQYLAAAGIGRLGVIDDDAVDLSNLQRQVIHRSDSIGMAKAERAVDQIAAINPDVKRVSGRDPVKNALAFARYAGDGGFGWNVNDPGHGFVLVRADSPLEAAAAAPLSAGSSTESIAHADSAGTLPPEVRSYLLDVKPGYTTNPTRAYYNHVWVIGDQEAIDVKQQAEANELAELAKIGAE